MREGPLIPLPNRHYWRHNQRSSVTAAITSGTLNRVCFAYDGSKTAAGVTFFGNGATLTPGIVTDAFGGTLSAGPVRVFAII
jgi:hypothetical protein